MTIMIAVERVLLILVVISKMKMKNGKNEI